MTVTATAGYYVIRCTGVIGTWGQVEPIGRYLSGFDPNAIDPTGEFQGRSSWTRNRDKAIRFTTRQDAQACLDATPADAPFRPDGTPNRPLATYETDIELVPVRDLPPRAGDPETDRILEELWLDGLV
jgi:hypothetical protein